MMSRLAAAACGWIVLAAAWAVPTEAGWVDPLFVAAPSATLSALVTGMASGELPRAAAATMGRAVLGFVIAMGVGIPVGLLIGGVSAVRATLGPVLDALRSVPSTALFPAFLLFFGIGDSAKVAVSAFVCAWPSAVIVAAAVRSAGATPRRLFQMHEARWWQQIVEGLLLPALPGVVAAMKSSLSLSLIVTIATEMIVGTATGLGQAIFDAQITFRIPAMYAAILVAAACGIALNVAFDGAFHFLAAWGWMDDANPSS
jgi:NitT/TauT family transport system permease protein